MVTATGLRGSSVAVDSTAKAADAAQQKTWKKTWKHQIEEFLLVAIMVIMERSRSPTRPPSLGNEPRPLVGFPVWTRPMGSGTPALPPRQYPSNFPWSQQGHGASTTPEVRVIAPVTHVSKAIYQGHLEGLFESAHLQLVTGPTLRLSHFAFAT